MMRLNLRPLAEQDIDRAVDWYLQQDAEQAAMDFLEAVEATFVLVCETPHIGSNRYNSLLPRQEGQAASLKFWRVGKFPWLVFYFATTPNHIDVVRVLHGTRDIPSLLTPDK